MKNNYKTLRRPCVAEIMIKKSRFIATATPVDNEEEAQQFISLLKKEHNQATHNVFAYVIDEQIQRFSDDGEPSGTAGRPVLDTINRRGLVRTALVVTRYFGGVLLGAGGLVRAYAEAAAKGIEAAGEVDRFIYQQLSLVVDYHWFGTVLREIENAGGQNLTKEFGQQVALTVFLRPGLLEALVNKLTELTAGQISVTRGDFSYI